MTGNSRGQGQNDADDSRPLPPFSRTVWFYIALGVTVLVIVLSVVSYTITANTLENNAQAVRRQTEENLAGSMWLVDTGLHFLDLSVNRGMEESFSSFVTEYHERGGNVSQMDLGGLKEAMNGKYDLFVIDSGGVIISTTYPPDLGLNFSEEAPYFQDYLTRIRQEGGFYPDQLVYDLETHQYKKYAYMPSPDHRYILELALNEQYLTAGWDLFRGTLLDILSTIKESDPAILSIRVFDTNRNEVLKETVVPVTDPFTLERLDQVIAARQSQTFTDAERGIDIRFIFVNRSSSQYGSDTSKVFEVIYSRALIDEALQKLLLLYLAIAVIALFLSTGVAFLIARRVSDPVNLIVRDVDQVAAGDFNHAITGGFAREFTVLEEAINRMVGRLRDTITRLREREEALRESEARYRAVVEGQTDLILQTLPDGSPVLMNDAFCTYFDVRREEVMGRPFLQSFTPDAYPRIQQAVSSLTPESPVANFEASFLLHGEPRWLHFVVRGIFDSAGTVRGYLAVARDQTKRREAEEALRDTRDFLDTILNAIPDPVFVKDRAHRYVMVNDAFCTFRQARRETIVGRIEREVFGRQNADVIWEQSETVFSTGKGSEVTWELREPSSSPTMTGRDWTTDVPRRPSALVCKRSRYIDPHGNAFLVGIIHDISREKQAEEAVRRINEELERRVAERTRDLARVNADLESFCYSVSHDLRSPLRAIDGYLGIYNERFGPLVPPDGAHYISSARQNVAKMATLIDDLLSLSRTGRQSLQLTSVDVADLARDVMQDLIDAEGGREIHFTVHDMPPAWADPSLARQVYQNLLSNALKFTRKRSPAEIEAGAVTRDGRTVYYVRDNGIGFDMRYSKSAFGVFQRLHAGQGYEGTGIGLAIVQRIIAIHGGEIYAEAEVDKGATFFITWGARGKETGDPAS